MAQGQHGNYLRFWLHAEQMASIGRVLIRVPMIKVVASYKTLIRLCCKKDDVTMMSKGLMSVTAAHKVHLQRHLSSLTRSDSGLPVKVAGAGYGDGNLVKQLQANVNAERRLQLLFSLTSSWCCPPPGAMCAPYHADPQEQRFCTSCSILTGHLSG